MTRAAIPFLACAAALALAAPAAAEPVSVTGAWARASFGSTAAAYVTIRNTGQSTVRLAAVTTPAARRAMIHETEMRDGIAGMRHVMSVNVAAGQTVRLKPGGRHIMLMGLAAPLKAGATFPLTLKFRKRAPVTVVVRVRPLTATGPGDGHPGH